MEKLKIIAGKEKEKFYRIKMRLFEVREKENKLYQMLDKMGLKFDIMGKPKNFKIV